VCGVAALSIALPSSVAFAADGSTGGIVAPKPTSSTLAFPTPAKTKSATPKKVVTKKPVAKKVSTTKKTVTKKTSTKKKTSRAKVLIHLSRPAGGNTSARFGARGRRWNTPHTGLDFAASYGSRVRSVMAGTVIRARWAGSFGRLIVIRSVGGADIWYAHLSQFNVHYGQKVKGGQVIGRVGQSGNATGPHLHLEVHKYDYPIDPAQFLWGKYKGQIKKMYIPGWAHGRGIAHLDSV